MFLIDGLWCVNPLFREFDIPVQMYGRLKIFDSHAVRIGFFEHRIHENPVSSAFSVFKKYAFLSERRHGYGGRSTGGSPCESPIAEYHIYNKMIIRIYPTAPRRGSKLSAHGIAMGIWSGAVRPEGAKALKVLV